jgi:hypothetical protein
MNEIFQFVSLRDDTMVSKWNFMFFAHETYDYEKFQIFIKVISLNFNLKQLYIIFILNFACESSKASD